MRALSLLFIILSLLAFKNLAFAQPELDACFDFLEVGDYKRAIEAGKAAVKKYPNSSGIQFCLGLSYYQIGELELALEHAKRAESLTSNKIQLIYIYYLIGKIYTGMRNVDYQLLYYGKSLSLLLNLEDKSTQREVAKNILMMLEDNSKLDKALGYYEESLRSMTDEKAKATAYKNIAFIYEKKGDYQKAVEYLQKAIEIVERYGDYHRVSIMKLNLGDTYRRMKDYEKAEKYLLEGLEGVKKVGDKYWTAQGYYYLGWLYKDKGDKKTAKDYLTRAYNLYNSIGAELSARGVISDIQNLEK
jgi:tetratricopeptide (TPR) repeat protein